MRNATCTVLYVCTQGTIPYHTYVHACILLHLLPYSTIPYVYCMVWYLTGNAIPDWYGTIVLYGDRNTIL